MNTASLERQKSLAQWVSQATGINTFGVKIQLRGNDLHILCEGRDCPQRWQTLSDLLQALQQTDLEMLTKNQEPAIYQVFVYGRTKGEQRPEWCHQVYLNQLDRHLEQVNQALIQDAEKSSINPGGAMIVSNESLARQGHPDAIARYLSETLSTLGVSVEVKVKNQQSEQKGSLEENRLWIFCQSSYSPDPSLIAEPVAQKLRDLKLVGYKDAVIASQVVGEIKPEWLLRIDLTPPEVMLKEWARWGDIQAIALLLGAALSELKVTVLASLKESTLHVFCTSTAKEATPDKTACWNAIVTQLEAIAPQGILAATVYGQKTTEQQPDWIDWLNLPASQHPALSSSAMELASSGDEPAIHFLIERLLNPDLNLRLKTGGIRVLLLRKGDLLHVMCDAPICPGRKKVAPKVTQCVRQLKIPNIIGVRVYGRRAGNKEPFWNYGVDFEQRQLLVPEATPEFAATSAYVNELLSSESSEPILRPDLTTEEVHIFVTEVARCWSATARKTLLATQLLIEKDSTERNADYQGLKTALVWGTLGLLLTLQTDWILGQTLALTTQKPKVAPIAPKSSSVNDDKNQGKRTAFFANTSGKKSQNASSVFNASGFTKDDNTPPRGKATATAILLAARSQMPSFNARQLDEQLALYKQRLAKTGTPPKVLIIGSSRALRGIDPAALDKALATQGYPGIDVFNFGINGATAKVVDFIIRRVLEPSELPKIIIWADGSRAFNSGRDDATFQAIAASAGYQQAIQKVLPNSSTNDVQAATKEQQKTKAENQNVNSYQAVNQSLNEALANVSATYQQRDRLKAFLNKKFKSSPIISSYKLVTSDSKTTENIEEDSQQAVDFDGFLPLSLRFNPRNYYQKHPKVSGSYDNDYKSFKVAGEQDVAFRTVLEFTQARKISLVFVNMPLTADYLDPVRIKYEQEFQQYMTSQVTNSSLIYRDLTKLFPQTSKNFSDPSHLNRFGAYEVSKKLANDPMIPWTTK
ncbi:MAG: DUF1574 family protein [Tolypothrix brevis GSE-NOS-MK-07-07A]|jgi:hypothetical protein|nr:DUF1574 family protein [Tolypothrix brevis GSE-NOS-MK-07-07A]